ncbi:hypothetical protein BD769DRAFT_1385150 [Suillus cothurnatus]|nr:hypothetical protein BD769DRAFT_1385150 [Suillus cothurnatus]
MQVVGVGDLLPKITVTGIKLSKIMVTEIKRMGIVSELEPNALTTSSACSYFGIHSFHGSRGWSVSCLFALVQNTPSVFDVSQSARKEVLVSKRSRKHRTKQKIALGDLAGARAVDKWTVDWTFTLS